MHPFDFIRNNDEKLGQYFIYPRRIGIRFELYERRPQSFGLDLRMGRRYRPIGLKQALTGSGALLWLAGNFLENLQRQRAEPEEEEE